MNILEKILSEIELPETAYEKAKSRYEYIAEWLSRPESGCTLYLPHIGAQGSFALGTATKPSDEKDAYDLDIFCVLMSQLTTDNRTQKQIKDLIGNELKEYAKTFNIKSPVDEKRRCWTIEYSDGMSFHIDVVPAIPAPASNRTSMMTLMLERGVDARIAEDVSSKSIQITDNKEENFNSISPDWPISNPEGYAIWFQSQMRLGQDYLKERALALRADIDDLPVYRWKTPLQKSIQLLKHHRDLMFSDSESKPISIIITTLATSAYKGERDLAAALQNILQTMESFVNPSTPLVPNPTNPREDFADKWYSDEHAHLMLKENFFTWLAQAKADFGRLNNSRDLKLVQETAATALGVKLLDSVLGINPQAARVVQNSPRQIPNSSAKPWFDKIS